MRTPLFLVDPMILYVSDVTSLISFYDSILFVVAHVLINSDITLTSVLGLFPDKGRIFSDK